MSESRIDQLLGAIDRLDVDAMMALAAPDIRLLTVDGRRAEGTAAARELLAEFLGMLRSSTHQVTAEWHPDDVLIAEVQASYELHDRTLIGALPRAFIVRDGPDGFVELHVYGAHEQPLAERSTGEHEMRLGGYWIPPL
jgi:SnoaL-like domain